jgi:hypothetical protein
MASNRSASAEQRPKLLYTVSKISLINLTCMFIFLTFFQYVVVYAVDQEMYAEVNIDFLRHSGTVADVISSTSSGKQYKVAMGKGSKRIEMDCLVVTFCCMFNVKLIPVEVCLRIITVSFPFI